jgi:hypothetical protein
MASSEAALLHMFYPLHCTRLFISGQADLTVLDILKHDGEAYMSNASQIKTTPAHSFKHRM